MLKFKAGIDSFNLGCPASSCRPAYLIAMRDRNSVVNAMSVMSASRRDVPKVERKTTSNDVRRLACSDPRNTLESLTNSTRLV